MFVLKKQSRRFISNIMNKPSLILGLLFLFSFHPVYAKSCDISGIWQHADKSATLLVDLTKSEVSVHQHDENPKANGLVVIKEVTEMKEQLISEVADRKQSERITKQ